MTDERLRELERRWQELETPEDEAAFLRERVRVGQLTQERLELAAYCGHEWARVATQTETRSPDELLDWLLSLPQDWAKMRAALLAAELVLPLWLRVVPGDEYATRILTKLNCWMDSPEPELGFEIRALGDKLEERFSRLESDSRMSGRGLWIDTAAKYAAEAVVYATYIPEDGATAANNPVVCAASARFYALTAEQPCIDPPWPDGETVKAKKTEMEFALRRELSNELVRWALK